MDNDRISFGEADLNLPEGYAALLLDADGKTTLALPQDARVSGEIPPHVFFLMSIWRRMLEEPGFIKDNIEREQRIYDENMKRADIRG